MVASSVFASTLRPLDKYTGCLILAVAKFSTQCSVSKTATSFKLENSIIEEMHRRVVNSNQVVGPVVIKPKLSAIEKYLRRLFRSEFDALQNLSQWFLSYLWVFGRKSFWCDKTVSEKPRFFIINYAEWYIILINFMSFTIHSGFVKAATLNFCHLKIFLLQQKSPTSGKTLNFWTLTWKLNFSSWQCIPMGGTPFML